MRKLDTLVAAGSFFCVTAVYGDWQYTKWGMTPDEVKAVNAETSENPERNDRTTLDFPSHATFTGAGHTFDAAFGFDRQTNKLGAVVLSPMDKNECSVIQGEMSSKYGTPVDASSSIAKISVWKDQKSGNRVEFTSVPMVSTCAISYYPVAADAENGL